MINFNGNTSKTRLKQARIALTQRAHNALQQLKLLKKKDTWIAWVKPDRLRRPRARRAGVTMFDVALWTLVLIPVLVSVLSLYNGVVDSTRSAALRSQLTRAVAIIERDHIYSGVYKGATLVPFLKNEGFTAKELGNIGSALKFTSPYGTDITIAPLETSGSRHFVVTLPALPPSGCEAAAMIFANQNSGLNSLVIAGSPGLGADDPIIEADVRDACDNDENTLVLTF